MLEETQRLFGPLFAYEGGVNWFRFASQVESLLPLSWMGTAGLSSGLDGLLAALPLVLGSRILP